MRKQTIKPAVFDGTNSLNVSGLDINNSPGLSVSFWYNSTEFESDSIILQLGDTFSKSSYIAMKDNAISIITKDAGGGSLGDGLTIFRKIGAVGRKMLTLTVDRSSQDLGFLLYENGYLVDTRQLTTSDSLSDFSGGFLSVGASPVNGQNITGEVYSLIISPYIFSAEEVKRLHNQGLNIAASSLNRLGLNRGLVCAYTLDEENEGIDLSGNGNHLSNINNVTFNGSPVDTLHTGIQAQNTLKADGTQYLTGAKISEVGEDFFFSCFAKFDDLSVATQYIFEEGFKVFLRVDDSGGRFYISYTSTVESRQIQVYMTIIEGQLYHLSGEVDAMTGRFAFYVDGVKIGEDTVSDTNKPNANTGIFAINYGSFRMKGSLRNIYFGRKAFGQQGVDWFRNKGVPRDLSIMPSAYANEAISIYEPTLLNGGKDISGNGNDCAIVGTPAYTAVEEVQKISDYMLPGLQGLSVNSADLNGTSQYFTAQNSADLALGDGNKTISVWLQNLTNGSDHLFDHGSSGDFWYISLTNDTFHFEYRKGGLFGYCEAPNLGLVNNSDQHLLTIDFNSNNAPIVRVDNYVIPLTVANIQPSFNVVPSSDFSIGCKLSTVNNFVESSISNITIWGESLSASEHSQIYNNGLPVCFGAMETALSNKALAHWKLFTADGHNDPLTDQTGRGNNLTNINNTPFINDGLIMECNQ